MRLASFGLAFLVASIALAPSTGCTTKFSEATMAYDAGDFGGASKKADMLCPTLIIDGDVKGLKVPYDRDRLWIGLEKAKIASEAGRSDESLAVFGYVDREANDLREIESWYAENPLDSKSWDAGQFAEDIGQAVMGADQTTYLLQPYEMILVKTYLCLESLLCGAPGAEAYAKAAADLQQFEAQDLARAGYQVAQPPVSRMDGAIRGKVPSGKSTDFSVGGVFSLGQFDAARQSMRQAIDTAKSMRAADPRVAFSTVVQWAAAIKTRKAERAVGAARQVAVESGAAALSDELVRLSGPEGYKEEWVLVLVDAGRAPERGSFNVRVPIIIPSVGSTVFRAVYPYLKFRADDRPSFIEVVADGKPCPAQVLTSIDAVASRNFQRREAELWWVPTVRAAARAVAAIVAQAAQEDDRTVTKLMIALGGAVVAEAEQPDLRAWTTLPASQHAAIVRRPADGVVRVRCASPVGSGETQVQVPAGASVVYVRALDAGKHVARVASLWQASAGK